MHVHTRVLLRANALLFKSSRLQAFKPGFISQPYSRGLAVQADNAFDETTDVLIVGSGAAGLVAALRAHDKGLRPLVIEKSDKIGGASAYSGGALWIPNNHVTQGAGVSDTVENALKYLDAIIGDVGPVSSKERRLAFLNRGPEMISFLEKAGFEWVDARGFPDYYPEAPGGKPEGRTIEPKVFNVRELGDWQQHLLQNPSHPAVPIYGRDSNSIARCTTLKGAWHLGKTVLWGSVYSKLLGREPMTLGRALVGQLMLLNKRRSTPIWRQSQLQELIVDSKDGSAIGAVVARNGSTTRVRAKYGVILAAGGFAKNQAMREKYGPAPATNEWTAVPPGDTGDAVRVGMDLGAETALIGDAWWAPMFIDPTTGLAHFCLWERSLPHGIMVDHSGQRFMNESQSYNQCGLDMYARNRSIPAIPTWLIVDSTHRKRYLMAQFLPGKIPQKAIDSGYVSKADTLEELAKNIRVDPRGLSETVARFNDMARKGVDEDFGRGDSAFDRFLGDPRTGPNSNLGAIEKPPFYAMKLYPGDIGTKGGLLTNEHAQVMHKEGRAIPRLYAAGNTTASVMGHTYPGPGGTLAPATTFAFIAVDHIADAARKIST